jgi:hypothetical protein
MKMINKIILLTLLIGIFISCDQSKNKNNLDIEKYMEPSKIINKEKLFSTLLKDTIRVGENAKALVSLLDPKFDDKQSQIIVFIESEDSVLYKLEKNFKQLYELPVAGFYNFTVDTINKAPKHYEKQYSAYIGKVFKETGYNKLRFMVMEFYGNDPTKDLNIDKKKTWVVIDELDVFVKPALDSIVN